MAKGRQMYWPVGQKDLQVVATQLLCALTEKPRRFVYEQVARWKWKLHTLWVLKTCTATWRIYCEPAVTHIVPPWFDYLTIHVNLFMVTLWRDKTFDNYFSVVMRSNWVFLCTCKGEDIQPAKQIISIHFDYQIRNKVTEYIRSHWQNGILNWLFWRQSKINHPSCTGGDKKKKRPDLTDVSVTSSWQDRGRQNQNITHIKGRATSYSRVGCVNVAAWRVAVNWSIFSLYG